MHWRSTWSQTRNHLSYLHFFPPLGILNPYRNLQRSSYLGYFLLFYKACLFSCDLNAMCKCKADSLEFILYKNAIPFPKAEQEQIRDGHHPTTLSFLPQGRASHYENPAACTFLLWCWLTHSFPLLGCWRGNSNCFPPLAWGQDGNLALSIEFVYESKRKV